MIVLVFEIAICYALYIEQDKENDSRNAQATQAVIQRRRRPKRRSTGVVHVDMDVSNGFTIVLSEILHCGCQKYSLILHEKCQSLQSESELNHL